LVRRAGWVLAGWVLVLVAAGRLRSSEFGRACRVGQWALEVPDPVFRVTLGFHAQMLPPDRAQ
jgi:hypothetical protein